MLKLYFWKAYSDINRGDQNVRACKEKTTHLLFLKNISCILKSFFRNIFHVGDSGKFILKGYNMHFGKFFLEIYSKKRVPKYISYILKILF